MVLGDLDPNERGRILSLIRSELSFPRRGEVTAVYEHSGSESPPSNHEVDVAVPTAAEPVQEHRRVPVATPASDTIAVPQVGDVVLVEYLAGDGDRPIVTKTLFADADQDRAPVGQAGDVKVRRGSLEARIAGDGSSARLALTPTDGEAPTAQVAVDDQGAVMVEATDDITISAGGDVVIDEGGTAVPVAKQDHTHDYSWGDTAGSGTTSTPNEAGTNTQIE